MFLHILLHNPLPGEFPYVFIITTTIIIYVLSGCIITGLVGMGVSISISLVFFVFFFCLSITYGWRGRLSFSFAFSGNGVCKKNLIWGEGGFFWVGKKSHCVVYHVLQNPSLVYTASYSALTFENELRCWLQTSQPNREIDCADRLEGKLKTVCQSGRDGYPHGIWNVL